MARLDIPPGEGGDAVQIWSLQPELGAAATRFVHAAYNKSILPPRVREAARMRIAQLNECTVCLGFRADTVRAQGLDEAFYCAVGTPDEDGLSEQERLAVEYAERFGTDHTTIDDAFIDSFAIAGPPAHCMNRFETILELGLDHLIIVGPGGLHWYSPVTTG